MELGLGLGLDLGLQLGVGGTELCDLSNAEGDLQCTGSAEGQTCKAWYGPEAAPPSDENVGACALPL